MTATAAASVISGMMPTAMPPPSGSDAALERADLEPPAVGREGFEQPVLDDDRQAEGDQQRRQDVAAERAVEQERLQRVAEGEHDRHDDRAARSARHAERWSQREDEERGEHDQVAMREIDQPHDAEDQRQAGGEERVEAAEQDSLEERVEPAESSVIVRNRRRGSRRGSDPAGRPVSVTRPSWKQ